MPLLVRWPSTIQPGSQSDHIVALTDVFATMAELLREIKYSGRSR